MAIGLNNLHSPAGATHKKKRVGRGPGSGLDKSFDAGEEVTPQLLHERGLIAKGRRDVVVLGTGDITKALRVSAHRFTKSAREKIESAGGAATVIEKQQSSGDAQ